MTAAGAGAGWWRGDGAPRGAVGADDARPGRRAAAALVRHRRVIRRRFQRPPGQGSPGLPAARGRGLTHVSRSLSRPLRDRSGGR